MKSPLEQAIEDFDKARDFFGTCGDGGCVVKRPVGMHTNGGCRCADDKRKAHRMMYAAQKLREALDKKP